MTTAVKDERWAPLANPEGKNLNPWQKLRPAKLATIPARDAPTIPPGGNIKVSTPWTYTGTLAVTTGTSRWYPPGDITIVNVRAGVDTAPTGASLIFDINKNGTTIFTTQANRPTIAISGHTASGTPDISTGSSSDYFQVDIDQVGSTIAGANATIFIEFIESGAAHDTITGLKGDTGATGATGAAGAVAVIKEVDGSPSGSPGTLKFPNGSLTDNGDGSYTYTASSGSVATDTIWDAKGDLAAGTGADTAAKLTAGANGLILMTDSTQTTGLKWAAGAWTTFTPTWTGSTTNPVIGNGTISGAYQQIGKTLFLRVTITFGSTTTFGSGNWRILLPNSLAAQTNPQQGTAWGFHSTHYSGTALVNWIDSTHVTCIFGTAANEWSPTVPVTWANGDWVGFQMVLETT